MTGPAVPRMIVESLRLAWRAGRRELSVMVALQVATIGLVAGEVVVGRSVLASLLQAERSNGHVGSLIPRVGLLAALTAILGVTNAIQVSRQRILTELCSRDGEQQVLTVVGRAELADFDDPEFHDELERANSAVRRLPVVVTTLSGLLRGLAGAAGAAFGLVLLQPLFAPAVMLVAIPAWLAARRRGLTYYRWARTVTPEERRRRYLTNVLSTRPSAAEVRAYWLKPFLDARIARLWEERLRELRSVTRRQLRLTLLATLATSAIMAGALLALAELTLSHDIGLASAGVTAAAIVLLTQRLTTAASSAGSLSESALYIDDFLGFVSREPGSAREPVGAVAVQRSLDVLAEGVTFSYQGGRGPAVRDVSLAIAPGEVVALVGENGSGKTTLAKLLAGLYVPSGGRVLLNGIDTAGAGREELRGSVAVVFQDFLRYALPVSENIGLGRHERLPDDAGVRESAEMAGAHGDIERLPQSYDTMLGPIFAGGTDLSRGQWQRVALARAIFRDAPFVILDEPTASLDAAAEHELFARIRLVLEGRSVLLISHRFSTVREADTIHVMRAGEIVESGSHDELIAKGGRYAELFGMQAAPYR